LSETELLLQIATALPDLGKVDLLTPLASFELSALSAEHYYGAGFVLIGDSAHTVHPLAGQGLNMGLADVRVLVEVLVNARKHHEDMSRAQILQRYEAGCRLRNEVFAQGFSLLNRAFRHEAQGLGVVLAGINRIHGLKRKLLQLARGTLC
jgi:2-polyprenyl-6-methoxyphenol hydroxylase-like FAD-dependent oxidoreductase